MWENLLFSGRIFRCQQRMMQKTKLCLVATGQGYHSLSSFLSTIANLAVGLSLKIVAGKVNEWKQI